MRFLAVISLALIGCLFPARLEACRYNVRDVGFVDFEAEVHHLYAFVGQQTPAGTVSEIRSITEAALRDANVVFELVNVDTQPGHPALAHRPSGPAERLPSAVLVSPDGPALTVAMTDAAGHLASDLASVFSGIVASPLRDAITASVTQAFGAVLLLEGTDTNANQRARQTIDDAIEQIRGHMKSLPKVIAAPPAVRVLEAASLARETFLLWTLRLDSTPTVHPRAAVFYGRGRWIGPLMNGDEISTRNLVGLFSIIGADCECDLDLGWTLGSRLPLRWPETLSAPLAKALGFDPENPLVKMEISSIVNRRGAIRPETAKTAPPTAHAAGESRPEPLTLEASRTPAALAAITPPVMVPVPASPPDSTVERPGSNGVWVALAAGGVLIIGFAALLLRRARQQGRLD